MIILINLWDSIIDEIDYQNSLDPNDVLEFCSKYFGENWDVAEFPTEVNQILESIIPINNQELEPLPLPIFEASDPVESTPPELELKPLPNTLNMPF